MGLAAMPVSEFSAVVEGRPRDQIAVRAGRGAQVAVALALEGPQVGAMAEDIAAALEANPDARHFFESLATFYRKNFIRWIEGAKRPETRAKRIAETVSTLRAGKWER